MDRVISKMDFELKAAEEAYRIRLPSAKAIALSPFIIVFLCGLFIVLPTTRPAALWMLEENRPVELLTFAFFLVGGIQGLALTWQMRQHREGILVFALYAVVSVGLLLIALEEVSWGQWLFGFETPSAWKELNTQGEATIHNLRVFKGHNALLRLIFGLGGLVGVWLSFHRHFRKIGAPVILLPWFLIIAAHAGLDYYNNYYPIQRHFDYVMQRLSELVEMLSGISGFLYIWLNARMLTAGWKENISQRREMTDEFTVSIT